MADTKISALTAAAAALLADELPVNEAGTTKKLTLTQVKTLLQTLGMPRVTRLDSQHQLASTTGTEVTDLSQTLEAGTYTFTYALIVRSATTTVGPMLGVNFTGTGSPRMHFRFADATTALTAEIHSMGNQGNKAFGFISGMASNAETTTAPDMGTTVGVQTAATDTLCFIEGIIIVTGSGDLELWHSSETATNTSVEVGSSLVVIRTDL
jgi:hypothetical protein